MIETARKASIGFVSQTPVGQAILPAAAFQVASSIAVNSPVSRS